jgi:hypothetical protein
MKVGNVAIVFSLVLIVFSLVLLVLPFSSQNGQNPPDGTPPDNQSQLSVYSATWQDSSVQIPVSNVGDASLTISQILINGSDYTQHSDLPLSLNPYGQGVVSVNFAYAYTTNYNFTLVYDGHSKSFVSLSPSAPPPAQLNIDAWSVEWTKGGVIIPLRNVGGTACTINRVLVNGTDRTQTSNLPFALAPSEQKPAAINFTYELGAFYTFTFTFDGRDAAVTLESPPPPFLVDRIVVGPLDNWVALEIRVTETMTVEKAEISTDNQTFVDITGNTTAAVYPVLSTLGTNWFYIDFPNAVAGKVSDYSTYYIIITMTDGKQYHVEANV